jgi:hypothetical protein
MRADLRPLLIRRLPRGKNGTLEKEFEAKLHGSGAMRVNRMQKGGRGNAAGIASGVVCSRIATDHVVSGIAGIGLVVDAELSVIEQVESLDAELEGLSLAHGEVFREGDVKVGAARIIEIVASGIAKRQTSGSNKAVGISQQRSEGLI